MKNIFVLLSALFVFGILFIIFILPLDESPECLTADQVIDLDINPSQFKDFRLVAAISGSHDKVVLISLYPKKSVFICYSEQDKVLASNLVKTKLSVSSLLGV